MRLPAAAVAALHVEELGIDAEERGLALALRWRRAHWGEGAVRRGNRSADNRERHGARSGAEARRSPPKLQMDAQKGAVGAATVVGKGGGRRQQRRSPQSGHIGGGEAYELRRNSPAPLLR